MPTHMAENGISSSSAHRIHENVLWIKPTQLQTRLGTFNPDDGVSHPKS
jgi:hypothetical protein